MKEILADAAEAYLALPAPTCPEFDQGTERRGRMSRSFHIVIEQDSEGYYVASVPSLPGCHTQARSLGELAERIKEAITLYLEVEGGNGGIASWS